MLKLTLKKYIKNNTDHLLKNEFINLKTSFVELKLVCYLFFKMNYFVAFKNIIAYEYLFANKNKMRFNT